MTNTGRVTTGLLVAGALAGALALAGASSAAAFEGSSATTSSDVIHHEIVNDKAIGWLYSRNFAGECPASHPWLVTQNFASGRINPGGLIINEPGGVGVTASQDGIQYYRGNDQDNRFAIRSIGGSYTNWVVNGRVDITMVCTNNWDKAQRIKSPGPS